MRLRRYYVVYNHGDEEFDVMLNDDSLLGTHVASHKDKDTAEFVCDCMNHVIGEENDAD
jgi:hypothetical protein